MQQRLRRLMIAGLLLFIGQLGREAASQDAGRGANPARRQLEQAFDNLDLLWEVGQTRSAAYAEAHNAFVRAHRQTPELEVFPLKMPISYAAQCVTYQTELTILPECAVTPADVATLSRSSYENTQRLLAQYYLDSFTLRARDMLAALQDAVLRDPDSALADFVGKVQAIIAYAAELQRDPQRIDVVHLIETQHVLNDADILLQVEQQIRQTLSSDISFASGKYQLADFTVEGQAAIQHFIAQLLAIRARYPLQYPGQPLIIKIKTVGYTDQVPVKSKNLVSELSAGVAPEQIPAKEIERQQFLNQRLSEFRARTINEYAKSILQAGTQGDATVQLETEIVGKGETLPVAGEVSPPYLRKDPRRRMCKISVIFHRQPLPFLSRAKSAP